jgi:hypothetical protein
VARGASVRNQVGKVRRSLTAFVLALEQLAGALQREGRGAPSATAGTQPRRTLRLSPQRRAALKLHGRYLGHLRRLKPAQKARVKALKAKRGYHAAIALAQRLGGK